MNESTNTYYDLLKRPIRLVILGLLGICSSGLVLWLGWQLGALLTMLCLILPLIIWGINDLRIGLGIVVVVAFAINFVNKYINFPVGISLDFLLLTLGLSVLLNLHRKKRGNFPKGAVVFFIMTWIGYNVLQLLNPIAPSRLAWVYTVRSLAILQFFFFVAYYSFQKLSDIKLILKFILILSLIAALYGLKQEFFGYSNQEWAWLSEKVSRYYRIVQWGRFRVFSLFSDPTSFGMLMAYIAAFCLILSTGPLAIWKKVVLITSSIIMLIAMAFAGSRTPFIVLPVGVLFYTLLNFNTKTLIFTGVFFLFGTIFILKSTKSPTIYRIQSAFNITNSASVQLRLDNQKKIQPFIQTHPFGAGLGTTGIWGERFSPNHWLAGFPHDSTYVRIAIESGWIGLLLYLGLFFAALKAAIHWYFRTVHPFIKITYLGLAVVVFMLGIASYAQEIPTLLPTSIIFYIFLAIIVRLKDFDKSKNS